MRHFSEAFRIPETIDIKNIKANYKNGLLSIELPKRKEAILETKKQIKNQLIENQPHGWFFIFLFMIFCSRGCTFFIANHWLDFWIYNFFLFGKFIAD